jgi:hypothetical protein
VQKEIIEKDVFRGVRFRLMPDEGRSRECADRLREEFEIEIENEIVNYIIDISKVDRINSSFIGVIGYMARKIDKNGYINVYGGNEDVVNSLSIAGLHKLPMVSIGLSKGFHDS